MASAGDCRSPWAAEAMPDEPPEITDPTLLRLLEELRRAREGTPFGEERHHRRWCERSRAWAPTRQHACCASCSGGATRATMAVERAADCRGYLCSCLLAGGVR
jgi:hypothetical protein